MNRYGCGLLMVVLLSGCLTERRRASARDRDGDGYEAWEVGGADCDDTRAAVNPGASELCGNQLDDDCDGLVDDGGTGEVSFYRDVDGDGVPGSTPTVACEIPGGAFADLPARPDCDDNDASRSPALVEVWYDGIDQDCDGNDEDADRDGYAVQDDCDDTSVEVNPGSVELCGNGRDDDCDEGERRSCWYPESGTLDDVSFSVLPAETMGDVADQDGDGIPDLLLTANGEAYLFLGPMTPGFRSLRDADVRFNAESPLGFCGLANVGFEVYVIGQRAVFCTQPGSENVRYWMPPYETGGTQSESNFYFSPFPADTTGSGFAGVAVAARGYGASDGLIVLPGTYSGPFGTVPFEGAVPAYTGTPPMPLSRYEYEEWPDDLSVPAAVNSFYPRRPFILEEGLEDVAVYVASQNPDQLGVVHLDSAHTTPLVRDLHPVIAGHDVVGISTPRDIDGDGDFDVLVGTEVRLGGTTRTAISLVRGPLGQLEPGYTVPDTDVLLEGVVSTPSTGTIPLYGFACQLDDDSTLEFVILEGELTDDLQAVFSAAIYEMDERSAPIARFAVPGGLAGCWDLDDNGLDDLMFTPLDFGQVIVTFTGRE